MGLMSLFSSDKTKNCNWEQIENAATSTLFAYYKTEPEKVFSGLPRLMLQKDLELNVYNDQRNPKHMWGLQDKTLVFLETNQAEYNEWRAFLLDQRTAESAKIFATQNFARTLTKHLKENVQKNLLMTPIS